MSTVVVGAELRDKLLASRLVEVLDEEGQLLGRFVREEDLQAIDYPPLGISIEELNRRCSSDSKAYTTEEVLEHLRRLK